MGCVSIDATMMVAVASQDHMAPRSRGNSIVLYVRRGFILSALLVMASPSFAGDDVVMLPIADVINSPEAQTKLNKAVRFYFGTKPAIQIIRTFGKFVANPKTNAFAKTENSACEWVFLSALISLQNDAEAAGANAVVNIESFYKKHKVSSQTEYECHKGFLVAGVALRGDVVRLADH